jgi:hypothetical protein
VKSYLSGDWRPSDFIVNKRQSRYEFNNGKGAHDVFKVNEDGSLEKKDQDIPEVEIVQTKKVLHLI